MANEKLEIDEQFLENLMAEVKNELNGLAKSEVAKLAKADSPEQTPSDDMSEGTETQDAPAPDNNNDGKIGDLPGKPEAPNDASNAAEVVEAPAEEQAEGQTDELVAAPEGAEGAQAPSEPGAIDASPSVEVLQSEYDLLSDEDLHNHFLAAKKAICARMGVEEAPPEAAPEAPMVPPMAADPAMAPQADMAMSEASDDAEMDKGEKKMVKDMPTSMPSIPKAVGQAAAAPAKAAVAGVMAGNKEPDWGAQKSEKPMAKSEPNLEVVKLKAELELAKALVAKQEETMLKLVDTMHAPMRKSIKGISELAYIPKTDETKTLPKLSKAKALEALNEKARSEDLKKSDRALINSYFLGNVNYEAIAHLLTDVK